MSNFIDQVLQNFQNFDKPNEDEFAEFIRLAGAETRFTLKDVTPVNSIIEDLNSIAFDIGIREVYIVQYGGLMYLLYSAEGPHGLGGTPFTESNLTPFMPSLPPVLVSNLKPTEHVGGITPSDNFIAGTTLEFILNKLLISTAVSTLSYTTSSGPSSRTLLVGTTITINTFTWHSKGTPSNMRIADGLTLNIPVTGTSEGVDLDYSRDEYGSITWTLSADEGSTSRTTSWMYYTYTGKSTSELPPTNIGLGSSVLLNTTANFTVNIATSSSDFGWVAVHKAQSKHFTKYYMSDFNQGTISSAPSSAAFYRAGDVMYEGETFEIFMMAGASEISTVKFM